MLANEGKYKLTEGLVVCQVAIHVAIFLAVNVGEFPFHAVSILEDGCGRRLGPA